MNNLSRAFVLSIGLAATAGLGGCLPPPAPRPLYSELPRPAVEVTATSLVLNQAIFFEFDKDQIAPVSFPILDEVSRVLREHPELARVRIEGHTDNKGTPSYNLSLSQRRAQAVQQYLYKKGVQEGRVSAVGFGQSQPIAENASDEGRAQNRRVTFMIERRHPSRQAQR